MMHTEKNPRWVQAAEVKRTRPGYVTVTVYGETFEDCKVGWHDPHLDEGKSDVLVQSREGDWLRVWFYDKAVK